MEGEYFVFGLGRLYIAFGYKIFRTIVSVVKGTKDKWREEDDMEGEYFSLF